MKLSSFAWLLGGAAALALGSLGGAAIERLDLRQMVQRADGAVSGTIVAKHVIRIDHEVDGPELYYTILTVEGSSLTNGAAQTVEVTFPGGFVNATEGVFNSEAPSADDQRIGNKVVVFYKAEENIGGDLSGNALMCSHGGLYRTFQGKQGVIVQGRGDGYAVATNIALGELGTRVQALAAQKR
jgi:hypothetical protein